MGSRQVGAPRARPGFVASIWKFGVGTLSAGAALASILSSSSAIKEFVGLPTKSLQPTGPEARWVGLTPSADTATSLGDSIHLAVTATDARGATVNGVAPVWTSTDEAVASVDQGGTVVARGAGVTTVVVSVGRLVCAFPDCRPPGAGRHPARRQPVENPGTRARAAAGGRSRRPRSPDRRRHGGVADFGRRDRRRGQREPGAGHDSGSGNAHRRVRRASGRTPVEVLAVPASVTVVAGKTSALPAAGPCPRR